MRLHDNKITKSHMTQQSNTLQYNFTASFKALLNCIGSAITQFTIVLSIHGIPCVSVHFTSPFDIEVNAVVLCLFQG